MLCFLSVTQQRCSVLQGAAERKVHTTKNALSLFYYYFSVTKSLTFLYEMS